MVRRYELTEEAFGRIKDLLPANGRRGGQWNCHSTMLNGIFWILYTGAHWRELPERYGKWKSVYDRYNRWRRDSTIDRMLERLHLKLDEQGRIDVDLWCIDATQIRASRAAAGAAGVPRTLFRIAPTMTDYDVHPDGARFLMTRTVGGAGDVPDQLVVVQHFSRELRARLP